MKRYSYILSELKKNDIDRPYLCQQLDRSHSYVSLRFNGKGSFTLDEAYAIMRLGNVPPEKIFDAFPPDGIPPAAKQPKPRLRIVGYDRRRA